LPSWLVSWSSFSSTAFTIFRERGEALYAYIAKQDLEARVLQVEHDETDRWGGAIGSTRLRIDVVATSPFKGNRAAPAVGLVMFDLEHPRPVFPISLRATRSTLL
jgi:nitrogen fixation protein NifT